MAGRKRNTETASEIAADTLASQDEKPGSMLGHNSSGADENTRQLLQSFIRRIENIDDELANVKADKAELMKEIKGQGFNLKIIGIIIRRRKRKLSERTEEEALVETYEAALEGM